MSNFHHACSGSWQRAAPYPVPIHRQKARLEKWKRIQTYDLRSEACFPGLLAAQTRCGSAKLIVWISGNKDCGSWKFKSSVIPEFTCWVHFRDWRLTWSDLFQQREILHEIQRRKEEIKEEKKRKEMAKQVLSVLCPFCKMSVFPVKTLFPLMLKFKTQRLSFIMFLVICFVFLFVIEGLEAASYYVS